MRGYGRDYDHRGNWLDRAGETVRGWFGGGRDYDRDYGPGNLREWEHGNYRSGNMMGGGQMLDGYHNNNRSNTRAGYDSVYRASGGYYGADYDMGRGYDRDMNGGWNRGGSMRGGNMGGGNMGGGATFRAGGGNRGYTGGGEMGRGGMGGGNMDRGGTSREWTGNEYGGGYGAGNGAGNGWGDYNQGGWGGDLYRRSNQGGVEPGRHFRGYGHGSTSGSGYEPL